MSGWLGIIRNSATILPVASAILETAALAPFGMGRSLLLPAIARNALLVLSLSGLTTTNQCSQSGWSTSLLSRHDWEVSRITYVVDGLPLTVLATFQLYAVSGLWMYSSSGVLAADIGGLAKVSELYVAVCSTITRITRNRIGHLSDLGLRSGRSSA